MFLILSLCASCHQLSLSAREAEFTWHRPRCEQTDWHAGDMVTCPLTLQCGSQAVPMKLTRSGCELAPSRLQWL